MMAFMRMTFKSQGLGFVKPFVKIDTKHKKILEGFFTLVVNSVGSQCLEVMNRSLILMFNSFESCSVD
jgi:hypothetical protein